MKKIIALLMMILMTGCATVDIDGTVDPTETAMIRVAVGMAMTAEPDTVLPAYAVSTALLAIMDGTEVTSLDTLDQAVDAEINDLALTTAERASFMELVTLVKARIIQQLNLPDLDAAQKLVIVRNVIQIVRDASMVRI